MGNLISLNIATRASVGKTPEQINDIWGIDPEDIVTPIRGLGAVGGGGAPASKTYFTLRIRKGMEKTSRQVARIDYVVAHTLAQINAKSDLFFLANVIARRPLSEVPIKEQMVFVASRIHGEMRRIVYNTASGYATQFFYEEDGDVEPVEYIVSDTVASLVAQTAP